LRPPCKQVGAFKTQNAARTARHTFTARQALAVDDGFPAPNVGAYVNLNRTIIGANAALNTAGGVWHNMPARQNPAAG